jgi:hypothetical protein
LDPSGGRRTSKENVDFLLFVPDSRIGFTKVDSAKSISKEILSFDLFLEKNARSTLPGPSSGNALYA